MKEAKREGKRAWVAYDTLLIEGHQVQQKGFAGDDLSVLSWGIQSLTQAKKESEDFVRTLTKYDICFLHESWC
ncbi:hypothetical protein DPMN_056638 [Dreissena polymorpha]|uniref:Uncharacterized protein n=1 Tax=Dreissena polymorpha TaxID=45954 RepID=A0A9D4HRP7_DREPO|nr:hypothetical protein DPMN_056638 [Dreissena polymorpha]